MNILSLARRHLPILDWGARYTGKTFTNDLIVALTVTVMHGAPAAPQVGESRHGT
jgi:hypothetical protein